jgi:hypothetical protein
MTAAAFLADLVTAVPYKIHTILTDKGIQFCHAPRDRSGPTAMFSRHMFDRSCLKLDIEHRVTKPKHPWATGQVERMNRTIKDATVKRYHYGSHDQLNQHLHTFLMAYTVAKRLNPLTDLTPYEYLCSIWTKEPTRFTMNPLHFTSGLNT